MKRFLIFTTMMLLFVLFGCSLTTTTKNLSGPTTQTSTTDTTTISTEPVNVVGILDRIIDKMESYMVTNTYSPLVSNQGLYTRESILNNYVLYLDSQNLFWTLSKTEYIELILQHLRAIGDQIEAGLEPDNGSSYQFQTQGGVQSYDLDTVATFSNDLENALIIEVTLLWRGDSGPSLYTGTDGIHIGFDDEGKISFDYIRMGDDLSEFGKFQYFRYAEDDGFLLIRNHMLCPAFSIESGSFIDGSKVNFYREYCEEGSVEPAYSVGWFEPETGEYYLLNDVEDGIDGGFSYYVYDNNVMMFRISEYTNINGDLRWNIGWNLMYASGWDSLFADVNNSLLQNDNLILEGVSFTNTSTRTMLTYNINVSTWPFSDEILNLSAYGMIFEGIELSNAILEAKYAYALSKQLSMTVIDEIDFLVGDPYEQAKALLPQWAFELSALAYETYTENPA